MKPVENAKGELINWLNYKTGIKNIFFRMDADGKRASIAIELTHPDALQREKHYQQFAKMKLLLTETAGEEWIWQKEVADEHGKYISRIGTEINNVNVFNTSDWPAIISFLKPRMISLDKFWNLGKDAFQ